MQKKFFGKFREAISRAHRVRMDRLFLDGLFYQRQEPRYAWINFRFPEMSGGKRVLNLKVLSCLNDYTFFI